jgi:hypothetical protein
MAVYKSFASHTSPRNEMRGAWDQGCEFVRIVIDRLADLHDVDRKDALSTRICCTASGQ